MFNFCLNDLLQMIRGYTESSLTPLKCYTITSFQRLITSGLDKILHPEDKNFWQKYIETVFEGTDVTIDFEKDEICATAVSKKFLLKIFSWIKGVPTNDLELYIWYNAVSQLAYYTGAYFREVKNPRYLCFIQM
jgi:hypothetical protein